MSGDPKLEVGGSPTAVVSPAVGEAPKTIVGSGLRALGGVAAVGAFGLWIWFVVASFGRLWERVSFGSGPEKATKLEVLWALVGWAMGPIIAFMIFAGLASLVDGLVARWRGRRTGGRTSGGR